jgi:ribokinase
VEFRLLGPVEARIAGRLLDLGPPKQRCILAVLLIAVGEDVPIGVLEERVWGAGRPTRDTVHGYVTRLRNTLSSAHPEVRLLHPRGGAYRLDAPLAEVDYHLCHQLIKQAKQADRSDHDAIELFDTALAMRRGAVLSGLSGRWVDSVRVGVDEMFYTAALDRFDVALRLGWHSRIVDQLVELSAQHSLDERLAGQTVLALYGAGRYAEALEYYQATRGRLISELGSEPGAQLQQLHRRILRRDPTLLPSDRPRTMSVTDQIGARQATSPADDLLAALQERLRRTADRTLDFCTVSAQNLDIIHQVERIAPDHEEDVRNPLQCPGGSGANTAIGLATLGVRTGVAGAIGDDPYGRLLRSDLEGHQVDTTYLIDLDGTEGTGHTLVFTDGEGRRLIYVSPGVNENLAEAAGDRGLLGELVALTRRTRILHLSSFTGSAERQLQERLVEDLDQDVILTFTPGTLYSRLGADRLSPFITRANLIFLYEQQLDQLLARSSAGGAGHSELSEKLSRLYEWRQSRGSAEPLIVVVKRPVELTRGKAQDYLSIGYGRTRLEDLGGPDAGTHRRQVTDSTGAGDALAGGFLFGLLNGRPPRECANLAFLMALIVSSGVGARARLPYRNHLSEQWREHLRVAAPTWLRSKQ